MAVVEKESSFEPKPFGRYVLLDKLAVGGMAEIYKAKTYGVDGFEKLLAIKRILPHCAADKEFIHMLVDEAKLTVLLSHANIVQVYDLGKVGDDYFISMEYIGGTNLREVMTRRAQEQEKIPEEIAVYIISEVCKGLDYAHRKTDSQGIALNIVHRDISPQNILISYEGEVKIVDFGIAKAAMNVSHTMAGILKGKIAYMSPEQALGKPLDHRTDVFSTAVLLYEMLTGEKLFSGETQFEVLNQIRTTRVNMTTLPENLSGPLKTILTKGLAYNPKDRYQSAGDFQLDLTKYLYSSFIDFSPRQLAALLSRLFEKEIKRKETAPLIDDKTRSVLIRQAGRENIVVHGATPAGTMVTQKTGLSEVYTLPRVKRTIRPAAIAGLFAFLALGGYLGYRFLVREKVSRESATIRAPTEKLGGFQIATSPIGARIFLNGADTGLTTPSTLEGLELGQEYEIRLIHEKYKESVKKFALTTTVPVPIHETLSPLPLGIIEISSQPVGATIFLDGKPTDLATPNRIANLTIPKNYRIRLALAGHADWSGEVAVNTLDPVKLAAVLTDLPAPPPPQPPPPREKETAKPKPAPVKPAKPAAPAAPAAKPEPVAMPSPAPTSPPPEVPSTGPAAKIKLDSEPSGAEVYVNAEFKGTTPLDAEISSGSVKLVVVKEGYLRQTANLNLKPGESRSLGTLTLEGLYGELILSSTPPRASIYFDGEPITPKTPVTITKVPRDRSHTVKLLLEGFRPWETSFEMKNQKTKRYDVILEKD